MVDEIDDARRDAAAALAASLTESEREIAERKSRQIEGWLRRMLAVAGGDGITRGDVEAIDRVHDALVGSVQVQRVRALAVVEEWLANRQTASVVDLAKGLGRIDHKLLDLRHEGELLPRDISELRGTAKRTGTKWDAKRVLALLCHRCGALGFLRLPKTQIDSNTLKNSADLLAGDREALGDWPSSE